MLAGSLLPPSHASHAGGDESTVWGGMPLVVCTADGLVEVGVGGERPGKNLADPCCGCLGGCNRLLSAIEATIDIAAPDMSVALHGPPDPSPARGLDRRQVFYVARAPPTPT